MENFLNTDMGNVNEIMFELVDICDLELGRVDKKSNGEGVSKNYWDGVNDGSLTKDSYWLKTSFFPGVNEIGTPREDGTRGLDSYNAFRSTTQFKFYNTSLGGHISINPRPQFTRYADIRNVNKNVDTDNEEKLTVSNNGTQYGNYSIGGMGRYYSEAIDDNAEIVYLQFGTPRFNSMFSFLTRAISYEDAYVANHGRLPLGYGVGKFIGGVVIFAAFPLITSMIWIGKFAYSFLSGDKSFDYYYMEPTMVTYWGSVNTIVTQIATELGILHPIAMDQKQGGERGRRMGVPVMIDQESIDSFKKIYPGIIEEGTNYIDVFAIVTRAQKLAINRRLKEREALSKGSIDKNELYGYIRQPSKLGSEKWVDKIDALMTPTYSGMVSFFNSVASSWFPEVNFREEDKALEEAQQKGETTLQKAADGGNQGVSLDFNKKDYNLKNTSDNLSSSKTSGEVGKELLGTGRVYTRSFRDGDGLIKESEDKASWDAMSESEKKRIISEKYDIAGSYPTDTNPQKEAKKDLYSILGDENAFLDETGSTIASWMRGGGEYAIFSVDYSGGVSDSFSNSIGQIETVDSLRSVSQSARNIKFNFSGGNIVGSMIQDAIGAITNLAMGTLDSVSFGLSSIVSSLTGGAYIDIPKKWEDSDISLGTITYNIDLVSPYGNTLSQLQNIYIPLAMLLAGSLPQKAGEASYTSPFLCSLFNKGKQNISLGMITSLTIERGTSNLAYNKFKKPLAFKVSFSVTDFSNLMTTPIAASFFGGLTASINEVGVFGRYLSTICSRSLLDDRYNWPMYKRKFSKLMMSIDQATNRNLWEAVVGDSLLMTIPSMLSHYNSLSMNEMSGYDSYMY